MQFFTAIFVAIFALGVQASVVPISVANIAGTSLQHTAVSGPAIASVHGLPGLISVGAVGVPSIAGLVPGIVNSGLVSSVLGAGVVPSVINAGVVPSVINAGHGIGALGLGVSHGGLSAVHLAHPIVAHEGQYLAKTRGAVHSAPLAGHANSAVSINLQPAPGTV